jgi:transcriptional regulator with GAF, ATPase, and Fis domain
MDSACDDVAQQSLLPVDPEPHDLVGDSAAMERLRREIAAAAPLPSTVLISGETGVGKGLAARSLHGLSPRRTAPFVHVDCAALSSQVVESELFGHERGAFTSAHARRVGRFELAAAGTLFLDEIGDLEPRLQAKLLRVLQDRCFERLGGNRTLRMRARIVAATARKLRSDVASGRFRADLYYRLAVIPIEVPPLRARSEDIPGLLRAAAKRCAALPAFVLTDSALARLADHDWPGNVRELQNVAERIALRSRDRPIDAVALDGILDDAEPGSVDGSCADDAMELAAALRAADGNVSRAARRLGIPRTTLRHRIRRLGIG